MTRMIRKVSIGLIAAAWAGVVSPAHAAPTPKTFTVSGHVISMCSLGTSTGSLLISTTVPSNGKLDTALNGKTFNLTGTVLRCALDDQAFGDRASAQPAR